MGSSETITHSTYVVLYFAIDFLCFGWQREEAGEDEEEEGMDPAMAQLMGFGGFGGSRK